MSVFYLGFNTFDSKVQNPMSNNYSRQLGRLIQQKRLEQNLPLRKIAAELDIDTSTLSKIEKGERQASLRMIPTLARLFNLGTAIFIRTVS